MRLRPILIVVLLACAGALSAESFEEALKRTDLGKPDSVFELGMWCRQNNLHAKAARYFAEALKLDPDHEPTRTALGQIKISGRWVKADGALQRPAQGTGTSDAAPAARTAAGPGPTAAQITWDLSIPQDPEPQNAFITQFIETMSRSANDSRDMDRSVNTILMEEHWPKALPRLCAALLRADFGDIYGASMIVSELQRRGGGSQAKILIGFLTKASERINDPDDLATFAYAVGGMRDRRVVPRLLELMQHGNADVKTAAQGAMASITLLPEKELSYEKAKAWWDLNHNVSDRQIYLEQLRSNDPNTAVQAARALYEHREKAIMPVLCKLIRSGDANVVSQAIDIVRLVTGNDWSIDPTAKPEARAKQADALEKWWSEEQNRFVWMADRNANPAASAQPKSDPTQQWVQQLGSVEGSQSQQAEASLRAKGKDAVAALLTGLESQTPLVRRKSHELLQAITKQQIAYDSRGEPEDRAKAVAAWKAWAASQGMIPTEGGEGPQAPEQPKSDPAGQRRPPQDRPGL